ncbi:MAG: hypothetical protein H3C51_00545 [Rubellimicrobium sp.]|nr:hypothetical protein [Rubellimicrobium sp.]
MISPDPDAVEDDQWLHRVPDRGGWVCPPALQWRTARALFDARCIDAPRGPRDLIEAAHGADAPPVPAALKVAEIARKPDMLFTDSAGGQTMRKNADPTV